MPSSYSLSGFLQPVLTKARAKYKVILGGKMKNEHHHEYSAVKYAPTDLGTLALILLTILNVGILFVILYKGYYEDPNVKKSQPEEVGPPFLR